MFYYMLCSGLYRYITGMKIDIFTVPFFVTTFYST